MKTFEHMKAGDLGIMMSMNPLVKRPMREGLQQEILGDYAEQGFSLIKTDEDTVALYLGNSLAETAIFTRPLIPQHIMATCQRHLPRKGKK